MSNLIPKYTFFAAILLLITSCHSLDYLANFNNEQQWKNIHYGTSTSHYTSDTSFVLVSNRHFSPYKLRFASEDIDTSTLHYFYILKKDSIWHVVETNNLEEACQKLPARNWLLYTEGMGKLFVSNLERAKLMTNTYQLNVIFFDYASINSEYGIRKNFTFSISNAKNSTLQFANLLFEIETLIKDGLFKDNKLSLFSHSMGNIMFRQMILDHYDTIFTTTPFIDNVILNAACVPQKNHEVWINNIHFAKHIYINYNNGDNKLHGASLMTGNKKLGRKPSIKESAFYTYVDFHQAVDNTHSYFLHIPGRKNPLTPAIQSYYNSVLNGDTLSIALKNSISSKLIKNYIEIKK
jgi:hypothetical protein